VRGTVSTCETYGAEPRGIADRDGDSLHLRTLRAATCTLLVTGCSVGAGSAYVGQWSPREQVDFEVCLQDEAGRCIDTKRVVSQVPGRRFWGVTTTFPAIGASQVQVGDQKSTKFRMEPSLEILKGSGRVAFGVRTSVLIDTGDKQVATALPVTAIGHLSLHPRWAVHAGLGMVPFMRAEDTNAFVGGRGLFGFQYALSKTHSENFIVLSLELDTIYVLFDEPYRSTGLTGHIGLFF